MTRLRCLTWVVLGLFFAGGVLFIYSSAVMAAQKRKAEGYIPVRLVWLNDSNIYLAITPTVSVNCTLEDDGKSGPGYLYQDCIQSLSSCYCRTHLPGVDSYLTSLMWTSGAVLIVATFGCAVINILTEQRRFDS
jgi:hypothetical protein